MDQFSTCDNSNGRLSTSMSSWCRLLPSSWFGAPTYFSHSQQNSVWPSFRNLDNSNQSAGVKLLRLDSQGYDDFSPSRSSMLPGPEQLESFTSNSKMASMNSWHDSGPNCEHNWLSFRSLCKGGIDESDSVLPRSSTCDKATCSMMKFPVQYQSSASSSLLSKIQSELYMHDTSFSCCLPSKPPLINGMVMKSLVDLEAQSPASVSTDLPDKIDESSWQKDVPLCQQIVNQVRTIQHGTCQPRFLCRRKNLCSRFSDRKGKWFILKQMSNLQKTSMLGPIDAWHRVKNSMCGTACFTVDDRNADTELDKIGASFSASVLVGHGEKSDNKCKSQLSGISSFFISPSELDSDDGSCDEDWNAVDSSFSSVPISDCSVSDDTIRNLQLQGCLPASPKSDTVYQGIEVTEDEVDGINRIYLPSCSKKCDFQLERINAKWNDCYTISEAFGNQNGCLQRKQKVGFCEDISFVPILNGSEWADDYSAARCGLWKVDQLRFNHRISEVEQQIGWVFSEEHRVKWRAVINGQCNQTSN